MWAPSFGMVLIIYLEDLGKSVFRSIMTPNPILKVSDTNTDPKLYDKRY